MTSIDARLEAGELSPRLVLQTERSWGTVLDIEIAPHVTVNGSPDGFREFARDLLDLVDTCSPQPGDVFGDIPPLLAEVDRLTAERVGHTLVPDAILEGLGQHDASGTDHLEEAMEACRERDVAEAEVRRLEAENARLRVISEAAQRLAFAAKQLEGWTDAFDTAAAEVIIAARTAPEQPANEAGEEAP